jgi:pyruvate, orthophosphate dikinase
MPKDRMIELLGEERLLLPRLLSSALEANDRVKYLLALLQAARGAADGEVGPDSLRDERLAGGVADAALDRVVPESGRENDGRYRIPGAERLMARAVSDVEEMLRPLRAAGVAATDDLDLRLRAVARALSVEGDLVTGDDLTRLCSGGDAGDSLHLVVMEAHRQINELAARVAPDVIDGARAYEVADVQRHLVQAFMRGVHATEKLKFDHPGLGTIAMPAGETLVIQNDLGTTDAHIVVLRVTALVVTITYTDVHLERLLFFQDLMKPWEVAWEDTRSRSERSVEGGLFHLAVGRFQAADPAGLERFLEHAGSRLVFIIDWNRARKRLRRLVGNRSAIELLRWAAGHDHGHMAFLRAGADELVYAALEFAGAPAARAGESLRDVLGSDAARGYLQEVMRICTEALLAGKTVPLIQDEAAAELIGYLRSARQEMQELALRHAELEVEIIEAARDGVEHVIRGSEERRELAAARAQTAEVEADGLVGQARAAVTRGSDLAPLLELIQAADDIADCGEEATFYTTLLSAASLGGDVRSQVRGIARIVLSAAREFLRAVELSTELHRGWPREDVDDFLGAVHRVIELEREADAAQRAVHRALAMDGGRHEGTLFVVVELSRAFEETSDALMHCAHLLREHTLTRVVRSEAVYRRPDTIPVRARAAAGVGRNEHVYVLGDPSVPVPAKSVIGAKGHGLAQMWATGIRVPEGVVLQTSLWRTWAAAAKDETVVREAVAPALEAIMEQTGATLGSRRSPLLLSVRSGAPVSMPGMLETVLNVGLCEASMRGLIARTGNPKLAWDSYRRLVESYAAVVHGLSPAPFDEAVQALLNADGVDTPRDLPVGTLRDLTGVHLALFEHLTGRPFPQDPVEQVCAAVGAVLTSWDAPRAREYRRMHDIAETQGTAVILQRMVFGNAGGISGAGVGFTRDPALGDRRMYMDFMFDAQGEDVVAGRHTALGLDELAVAAPDLLAEIEHMCGRLEAEFGDAQEFELTIEDGELFLLQTRTAKRTPWAALTIAVDQVQEGLISPGEGLARLSGIDLGSIRRRHIDVADGSRPAARAIPAGAGVAAGPIALDAKAAERCAAAGTPPVLVRAETVTDDVAAVRLSAGVLTRAGGRTSHAAVVARELGKPCLVGCGELELDPSNRTIRLGDSALAEGEVISLDAESGLVYVGAPPVTEERPTRALAEVEGWRRSSARPSLRPPGAAEAARTE